MSIQLHQDITINGKTHKAGETVPWYYIYPFFLFHMGAFGASGFFLAYGSDASLGFIYMHGGIAILVYLMFYLAIFGKETVKWLAIDSLLGLFGIVAQLGWILALFDKTLADYSIARHVIPCIYYILYTFLLHRAVLDFSNSSNDPIKRKAVDRWYLIGSLGIYGLLSF